MKPPSTSSFPRKRESRASNGPAALGSRFRGNDELGDDLGPRDDPGPSDLGPSAGARVCLGVVGAPHGVRGAVRIKSFTDEPAAIAGYGALEDEAGARQFKLQVISAAKGDGMIIAKLAGIADRDRAETLRGLRLYLPRAALPPPGEDEFYYADLIGLAAMLEDGAPIGKIIAVHDFGAGDVLEIASEGSVHGGQPVLVPFTRAAVPVVDLAGHRVVIDPPEGLIDPPSRHPAKEPQGEMA